MAKAVAAVIPPIVGGSSAAPPCETACPRAIGKRMRPSPRPRVPRVKPASGGKTDIASCQAEAVDNPVQPSLAGLRLSIGAFMESGRLQLLRSSMILMSLWLVLGPLRMGFADLTWVFATDSCGQILAPERLQQLWILKLILQLGLAISLVVELLQPKARYSAWMVMSLFVAGFLLIACANAVLNADLLTQCDMHFLGPRTSVLIYLATVATIGSIGISRFRGWCDQPSP